MNENTHRYGYARISTTDQTINLQLDALNQAGCCKVFMETASGKSAKRTELTECLKALTKGSTLVVWRLDRLGRSVSDLINIINILEKRGIHFESITENIETNSHTGKFIFHMFAALAEFERNLIRERTLAGLAAARTRGRIGGRKPKLSEEEQSKLITDVQMKKASITKLALDYGISRKTVYAIINKH